jgi:arsenate reductase
MAEAFARAYGGDVMIPASAGLAPASRVAPDTVRAMKQKGLDIKEQFPKAIRHLARIEFDLIINMSREDLPGSFKCPVRDWDVEDPVSLGYDEHCAVRDEIERLVMDLVLELRREQSRPKLKPFGSGRVPL